MTTTLTRINVQEEWYQEEQKEEEKDLEENQKRSEKARGEGETEPGESHMVCLIDNKDHHNRLMACTHCFLLIQMTIVST